MPYNSDCSLYFVMYCRRLGQRRYNSTGWLCMRISLNKIYSIIDQQIAYNFVHYSEYLYHTLPFIETKIINPFFYFKDLNQSVGILANRRIFIHANVPLVENLFSLKCWIKELKQKSFLPLLLLPFTLSLYASPFHSLSLSLSYLSLPLYISSFTFISLSLLLSLSLSPSLCLLSIILFFRPCLFSQITKKYIKLRPL